LWGTGGAEVTFLPKLRALIEQANLVQFFFAPWWE
jgi:hypothetical protein